MPLQSPMIEEEKKVPWMFFNCLEILICEPDFFIFIKHPARNVKRTKFKAKNISLPHHHSIKAIIYFYFCKNKFLNGLIVLITQICNWCKSTLEPDKFGVCFLQSDLRRDENLFSILRWFDFLLCCCGVSVCQYNVTSL